MTEMLTKQLIIKNRFGGHTWASFHAFSSIKSRRAAAGTPPILSKKMRENLFQAWLAKSIFNYQLVSKLVPFFQEFRLKSPERIAAGVSING